MAQGVGLRVRGLGLAFDGVPLLADLAQAGLLTQVSLGD